MKPRFDIQPLYPSYVSIIEAIECEAHITPWTGKVIADSFNKRSHNVGLFMKGNLVGYFFSECVVDEMTLHNLCISPDYQGKGAGSRLMEHLIALANKLKVKDLWLEVRESNETAIGLYQKFGFQIEGNRKGYYSIPNSDQKENAILMKKTFY